MAANRGNVIVFGKITIASDASSLQDMKSMLDSIIKTHGYPEMREGQGQGVQDAQEEFRKLLAAEGEKEERPEVQRPEPWKR